MYGGFFTKNIPWLMGIFFILWVFFIILSCIVYFWIGMLSTKAVPIACPSCEKPTRLLGRVDAFMHCKQPLTMANNLYGKEFDEKYNKRKYRRERKKEEIHDEQ